MNGEQFGQIVQELRLGTPLDQAVRRAGVHSADFDREINENPQLEEVIDDCLATARHKQKAARTYVDDPAPNDSDAPPVEAKPKKSTSSKRKGEEEKKTPPWERIAEEAREMGEGRYGYFLWLNEKCAAYGMHKISDWWKSMLGDFYASGKRCAIVRAGRGGGKALAVNTPIPTPSGWSTMGALNIGDTVFDEEGAPCKVIAVSSIMENHECYRVEFSDGKYIIADAQHLWKTLTRHDKRVMRTGHDPRGSIRTTKEIHETLTVHVKKEKNHTIPLSGSLKLPEIELPVHPYVLGVWLGDGTSANGCITSPDLEIVNRCKSFGYEMTKQSAELRWNIVGLNTTLRSIGLRNNKSIPSAYLRASFEQRLELLRGLMDTDGCCKPEGTCSFDTTTPALRDGFEELAISLGIKTRAVERDAKLNGRFISKSWRFSFNTDLDVFTLGKKLERLRKIQRCAGRRYITNVAMVESVKVKCIAVDSPSHMFLAGKGMIPTHNSTSLVRMASSEAIFTDRMVPPGQNWVWPFVSVNATDAGRRIPEIVAILNCLGIEHKLHRAVGKQSIDMLDKNGQQVSFLSLACNISALSGPTAIGGTIDEEAKLLDRATNANPATEVLASMIQTFRGQDVRMVRCSSAWDTTGSHALAVKEGDNSQNFVARIGNRFLPIVIDGLRDVALYLSQSGKEVDAKKVLDYAATVTGDSPNVPTWLANQTRDAVGCYRDNEALPRDPAERKVDLVDIFLRENASLPVSGSLATTNGSPGIVDYAERNRQLCAPRAAVHDLLKFDGLPSWDPRSRSFGGQSRKPTL